jgi:hypothetical protein
MAEQRIAVNFVTVAWGDWHLGAFLMLNLPTLLAPGNVPALAEQCVARYDIYTRAADVNSIESSEMIRRMREIMPVHVRIIPEELIADPIKAHGELWREATDRAMRARAAVLLIPPDVAWSDGAFGHIGKLLASGKKVLFNFYLRVVSDTFAAQFIERFRDASGLISVPSREMVEFSMHHIHPLMAAYCRDSENFPHHAEMVIWPVHGEGLLVRVLAREPLMFDPNSYELNEKMLVKGKPDRNEVEFVSDSDDLFAVSLAPLGKDIEWCLKRQKVEFMWLARWWLYFDSPLNDLVCSTKTRIHYVEPTGSHWRQLEHASDLFVRRAASYREALRIWRALHELKCGRAAEILALAMHTGAIKRLTPARGRLVVLAPSDEAIDAVFESEVERVISGRDGARLEDLLRAHLVVLGEEGPELEARFERSAQIEARSADGSRLVLKAAWGRLAGKKPASFVVNGRYSTSASLRSGSTLVLRLEGVLRPTAAGQKALPAHAPMSDHDASSRAAEEQPSISPVG